MRPWSGKPAPVSARWGISDGPSGDLSSYPVETATVLHDELGADSQLAGPGRGAVDSVLQSHLPYVLGQADRRPEAARVAAVESQLALVFLLRGSPLIDSGVDQGLGLINGVPADHFATRDNAAAAMPVLGGPKGAWERYDRGHPLYAYIAKLAALRRDHPALATGLTIERLHSTTGDGTPQGVFAFSRIDRAAGIEYLVVLNPGRSRHAVTLPTASPSTRFAPLLGTGEVTSDAQGRAVVQLDGQPVRVLRADRAVAALNPSTTVAPQLDPLRADSLAVTATTGAAPAETFIALRVPGQVWRVVGPVDHPPVVVAVPTDGIPAGTRLEVVAVTRTPNGRVAYAGATASLGAAPTSATVITAVGEFQKEVGCATNDQPGCAATRMAGPDAHGQYTWTSPPLTEGEYRVRVAVGDGSPGTTAFGRDGRADGEALAISWADAGPLPIVVTFDPATKWIGLSLKGFG